MRIAAVVLAGGRSRRFGSPKHLAPFAGGTLLETVVRRVSSVCDEVIVVGRPEQGLRAPGRASLAFDIVPERGPLGGLHAGLHATAAGRVLLLGCDMPLVSVPLLRHIIELPPNGYDAVAMRVGGILQPLPAIYHRDCLPAVERLLRRDSAGLRQLLARVNVQEVPEQQVRRIDRRGLCTFNVNTATDYDLLRDLYPEGSAPSLEPVIAARRHG